MRNKQGAYLFIRNAISSVFVVSENKSCKTKMNETKLAYLFRTRNSWHHLRNVILYMRGNAFERVSKGCNQPTATATRENNSNVSKTLRCDTIWSTEIARRPNAVEKQPHTHTPC